MEGLKPECGHWFLRDDCSQCQAVRSDPTSSHYGAVTSSPRSSTERRSERRRWFDRFRDERVVGTSTPGDWCTPGTLYQWREDHPWYRITRVVRVGPTRLLDGSLMPHFEVMGVRVPAPPPEERGRQFRTVVSLGDLGPGESVSVPLDRAGWQTLVRSDPSPMPPRFHLFGAPQRQGRKHA